MLIKYVSVREFNKTGTSLVCPITQGGEFARSKGFAVSLAGTGMQSQGVVLCNQLRTLDLSARGGQFVERVPGFVMDEVLAKLQTILD